VPAVSDIAAVHITLEVGGKQALFILLAADGSINRLGTGLIDNTENSLFIGITKEPLFAKLMRHLNDEMLNYMGGYDVPDQRGVPCKLSIGLLFAHGDDNGFGFRYGSQSEGPPHEIVQFITAAVQLTDPWFERQKAMASRSKAGVKKPWWKFW
jgi:hypothetical protein